MITKRLLFPPKLLLNCLQAVLIVAVTTLLMLLIGRNILGEAVIALLYLVPVGWSTTRWGQGPGMCAALTAALTFDYFFIPPFYTFAVGRLEGWLVLVIFFIVAIVVIGRIQSGYTRALVSEREAIFMYELSTALAGSRTQESVAHTLARQLQEMYLASVVKVVIQYEQTKAIVVSEPLDGIAKDKPDRILPILNSSGLIGEIQIWRGYKELPTEDNRLLHNFTSQAAQALERTRLTEAEELVEKS
jgi:K+-sensing histidine kinase KdpD